MEESSRKWDLNRDGLIVLLVVLVALNAWQVVRTNRILHRVEQLPTHYPSSNHVNLTPLYSGVVHSYTQILSVEVGATVNVAVDFRLTEKIPGRDAFVRYRENKEKSWTIVRSELVDGLDYRAILQLERDKNYECQVVQIHGDEIVRVSDGPYLRMAELVGSPEVSISITIYPNEGKAQFGFMQDKPSQVEAWQVERVTLQLDNVDQVFSEDGGYSYSTIRIDRKIYDAAKEAVVTVHYKDGKKGTLQFKLREYSGRLVVVPE